MRNSLCTFIAIGLTLITCPRLNASTCAPADITGDDDVNIDDLLAVVNGWDNPASGADIFPAGGDGEVNIDDLLAVINAWGSTGFATGVFPAAWISGNPNCPSEPTIQVHQYNENTYILRQSLCTNFEGPFIYLLFGTDKVLQQDTGASTVPLQLRVQNIIDQWLVAHNQASIQLIVSHTHAHGDHVFNDSQFVGKPNTTVVGTGLTAVKNFFGIPGWPTQIVQYDLGGRIVDVIPIPGHHTTHVALYDRNTRLLLTGDTLYPGRLYISDFAAYKASIQRLVDFTQSNPVCQVMGTHIEMTSTPTVDYPMGSTSHPNEHVLQLKLAHLLELNTAIIAMGNTPVYQKHADFIIFPLGGAANDNGARHGMPRLSQ